MTVNVPQMSEMDNLPPVGTAYNVAMNAQRTPFAKAKYGLGGYTPSQPAPTPGTPQRFGPSGNAVSVPRIQPLQFGSGSSS